MHSARMLRSVGKYNTDCAILSWNLSLYYHSQPSDGPFNSSDAYGYILLM